MKLMIMVNLDHDIGMVYDCCQERSCTTSQFQGAI